MTIFRPNYTIFFPVKQSQYKTPKEVPTKEEVYKFINSIKDDDFFIEARDYLMVKVLYQTGVRVTELLNIKKT